MSQYVPGVTIYNSMKGRWACLLQDPCLSEGFHSMYQAHMHDSNQKEAWHDQSIMWWHSDVWVCWIMTFTFSIEGLCKEGCMRGRGTQDFAYGYFSFSLTSYNLDFLRNRTKFSAERQAFASFQTGFLRSEENVYLNNLYSGKCISKYVS